MNTTPNEAAVIRSIACNSYNTMNYASPVSYDEADAPVWTNLINDSGIPSGIEGKALSGVVSSCNRKGFLRSDHMGQDACVSITETGWNAMVEYYGSVNKAFAKNRYNR